MKQQWNSKFLVVVFACVLILMGYQRGFSNERFEPWLSDQYEGRAPDYLRYDVPYIPQNDTYSCATTSLAMAISYYKDTLLDKAHVWEISGSSITDIQTYGNDMEGLQKIADYYGYRGALFEHMTIDELEFLLFQGALVVINVLNPPNSGGICHAMLITGYDKQRQLFFIKDPNHATNEELDYSDLNSRWEAWFSHPRGLYYQTSFVIFPNHCKNEARTS